MSTNVPPTVDVTSPRWRGINHLALVTPDMDATVRFYAGVLGMRLVATTMQHSRGPWPLPLAAIRSSSSSSAHFSGNRQLGPRP